MLSPDAFRDAAHRAEGVSVADLLALHGRASWPALLLVLAVLSAIPLAGVGTALSLPMFAVAWGWPGRGRTARAGRLVPERLLGLRLGERWSARCLHLFAGLYGGARRVMRRRWAGLRHARTLTAWRLWIAGMAFLILLPLPLGNVLPAISLALLGLGWVHRDGVALLLALLVGSAGWAWLALSAHLLVALWERAAALL